MLLYKVSVSRINRTTATRTSVSKWIGNREIVYRHYYALAEVKTHAGCYTPPAVAVRVLRAAVLLVRSAESILPGVRAFGREASPINGLHTVQRHNREFPTSKQHRSDLPSIWHILSHLASLCRRSCLLCDLLVIALQCCNCLM